MKNLIFLLLVLSGVASVASPRIPVICQYAEGEAQGYEQLQLWAFINPQTKQMDFTFQVSGADGIRSFINIATLPYAAAGKKLEIDLSGNNSLPSFRVSSDILTSAHPVAGTWNRRNITCYQYGSPLDNYELPASEFDHYNLPAIPASNPIIKTKTFKTEDGRFSFVATLYPAAPKTRNLPAVPPHTTFEVLVVGPVVDDQPDDSTTISYLLNGATKIVQARITGTQDVTDLIRIFGEVATIELFHNYGHNSPVQVDIDCRSGRECIVTAKN